MPKAKSGGAAQQAMTKSQLLSSLAESTGLTRKDVAAVLDGLTDIIHKHVRKRGPGLFTMPGLLKIKTVNKPATKARKGVNPFTGQEIMIKAKPARRVVKVLALKSLKEMAN
jgi:nucleoid DNA-binding protein